MRKSQRLAVLMSAQFGLGSVFGRAHFRQFAESATMALKANTLVKYGLLRHLSASEKVADQDTTVSKFLTTALTIASTDVSLYSAVVFHNAELRKPISSILAARPMQDCLRQEAPAKLDCKAFDVLTGLARPARLCARDHRRRQLSHD